MNWGQVIAWAGALLSLGSAVGYFVAKDYRKSMYFLFALCITVTVIYK